MSMRREGREAAIQFLYQLDMNATPQAEITDPFWVLHASENAAGIARQARAFADELIAGVNAHRADIDERITGCLVNFQFSRLATVDRNILRVAVYELIHTQTLSPAIVINEAIEIAKKFGGEKSGGFVNGILDRIKKNLGLPPRGLPPRGRPPGYPQVGPLTPLDS